MAENLEYVMGGGPPRLTAIAAVTTLSSPCTAVVTAAAAAAAAGRMAGSMVVWTGPVQAGVRGCSLSDTTPRCLTAVTATAVYSMSPVLMTVKVTAAGQGVTAAAQTVTAAA